MLPTPEPPPSDAVLAMIAKWDADIQKVRDAVDECYAMLASIRRSFAELAEAYPVPTNAPSTDAEA